MVFGGSSRPSSVAVLTVLLWYSLSANLSSNACSSSSVLAVAPVQSKWPPLILPQQCHAGEGGRPLGVAQLSPPGKPPPRFSPWSPGVVPLIVSGWTLVLLVAASQAQSSVAVHLKWTKTRFNIKTASGDEWALTPACGPPLPLPCIFGCGAVAGGQSNRRFCAFSEKCLRRPL